MFFSKLEMLASVLAVILLGAIRCHARSAFVLQQTHPWRKGRSLHYATPPGRVKDIDEWILLSSDSLKRFTGKSLLEVMDGVSTIRNVHDNERYAVLSHGNQTDPVYNYFNKGAFLTFQWPESEIYSLPSRYSAPDGFVRKDRQKMMQTVVEQNLVVIPIAIRQTKAGEFFQLSNVTLWNVYSDEGVRLGQTAVFDRTLIAPLE
jgi:hypothetical protein